MLEVGTILSLLHLNHNSDNLTTVIGIHIMKNKIDCFYQFVLKECEIKFQVAITMFNDCQNNSNVGNDQTFLWDIVTLIYFILYVVHP